MICPWDAGEPPMHVNEAGHKFWLDKSLTQYAHGKGLTDVYVMYVERANGDRTRLAARNGEPLKEEQAVDAMGVFLDGLALIKEFDEADAARKEAACPKPATDSEPSSSATTPKAES